jgi:hypothetical protein
MSEKEENQSPVKRPAAIKQFFSFQKLGGKGGYLKPKIHIPHYGAYQHNHHGSIRQTYKEKIVAHILKPFLFTI